jgi:hypothetical protein
MGKYKKVKLVNKVTGDIKYRIQVRRKFLWFSYYEDYIVTEYGIDGTDFSCVVEFDKEHEADNFITNLNKRDTDNWEIEKQ